MSGSGDKMLDIHTAGAKRHPTVWFAANEAAIHAARSCGVDYSKLDNKILLSTVVLRVLDAAAFEKTYNAAVKGKT